MYSTLGSEVRTEIDLLHTHAHTHTCRQVSQILVEKWNTVKLPGILMFRDNDQNVELGRKEITTLRFKPRKEKCGCMYMHLIKSCLVHPVIHHPKCAR